MSGDVSIVGRIQRLVGRVGLHHVPMLSHVICVWIFPTGIAISAILQSYLANIDPPGECIVISAALQSYLANIEPLCECIKQ